VPWPGHKLFSGPMGLCRGVHKEGECREREFPGPDGVSLK